MLHSHYFLTLWTVLKKTESNWLCRGAPIILTLFQQQLLLTVLSGENKIDTKTILSIQCAIIMKTSWQCVFRWVARPLSCLIREVLRTGKIPTGNPFFSNNKVCGFPGYFKLNCAKWREKFSPNIRCFLSMQQQKWKFCASETVISVATKKVQVSQRVVRLLQKISSGSRHAICNSAG